MRTCQRGPSAARQAQLRWQQCCLQHRQLAKHPVTPLTHILGTGGGAASVAIARPCQPSPRTPAGGQIHLDSVHARGGTAVACNVFLREALGTNRRWRLPPISPAAASFPSSVTFRVQFARSAITCYRPPAAQYSGLGPPSPSEPRPAPALGPMGHAAHIRHQTALPKPPARQAVHRPHQQAAPAMLKPCRYALPSRSVACSKPTLAGRPLPPPLQPCPLPGLRPAVQHLPIPAAAPGIGPPQL